MVLNRSTGKLVPAIKTNAPHSIDGINYAPFAAFGGWAGAINAKADQKTKDAAYAFLSYMNQSAQSSVDVTIGATGYNPYRISQLSSPDLFVDAGMPQELAENYIGAINGALNNLNMASDMKIPGAQKYTSVVLDTELARYLAGEISVDEALEILKKAGKKSPKISAVMSRLQLRHLLLAADLRHNAIQNKQHPAGGFPGWHCIKGPMARMGRSPCRELLHSTCCDAHSDFCYLSNYLFNGVCVKPSKVHRRRFKIPLCWLS